MTINLHAPTRRHLLLASGTLFAWAYLPKVARAEGHMVNGAYRHHPTPAEWLLPVYC